MAAARAEVAAARDEAVRRVTTAEAAAAKAAVRRGLGLGLGLKRR